jgi:hypothetical protein
LGLGKKTLKNRSNNAPYKIKTSGFALKPAMDLMLGTMVATGQYEKLSDYTYKNKEGKIIRYVIGKRGHPNVIVTIKRDAYDANPDLLDIATKEAESLARGEKTAVGEWLNILPSERRSFSGYGNYQH